MRLIPVMLALLLALSPGAVALQASAPTAPASDAAQTTTDAAQRTGNDTVQSAPGGNTTFVTTLGTDPARTAFDSPSLALGDSLTMDRDGFRTKLSVEVLDQQLAAAESDEQKKRILNQYRYRIENRIISLQAEEKRVTNAFINGTISRAEYLRGLGRIDTEVNEILALTEAMQLRAESIPRFQMKAQANALRGKLVTLEGPVRGQISDMMRGKASQARVYVAASDTGVVLSSVVGNEFVREVVRTDRRDPGASNPNSRQEARDAITSQYSWAWNQSTSWGINSGFGGTNIHRMFFEHAHGRLVAYYDAGTEEVFKEVQHKRLTGEHSLPPGPGVVNSSDNVTLAVNRTYPGGPLRVQLTNETGAPLQGEITVAGESVGRTNSNGVLWTLGPAEQFAVSATHDGTTVNVTATPVEADS
jgi:hypothetical protein